MTFCVTCVVDRIVTTHFLNPVEGTASSRSRFTGEEEEDSCSALYRVSVDSNQNKHVIFAHISMVYHLVRDMNIPVLQTLLNFLHYCLSKPGSADWGGSYHCQ
jgi:hypothetical protein